MFEAYTEIADAHEAREATHVSRSSATAPPPPRQLRPEVTAQVAENEHEGLSVDAVVEEEEEEKEEDEQEAPEHTEANEGDPPVQAEQCAGIDNKIPDVYVRTAAEVGAALDDNVRAKVRSLSFPAGPIKGGQKELKDAISKWATNPKTGGGVFGVVSSNVKRAVEQGIHRRGTLRTICCNRCYKPEAASRRRLSSTRRPPAGVGCQWRVVFELAEEGWVLRHFPFYEHNGHELITRPTEAMASKSTRQGIPEELKGIADALQADSRPVAMIYEVLANEARRRDMKPEHLFSKDDVRADFSPSPTELQFDTTDFMHYLKTQEPPPPQPTHTSSSHNYTVCRV